MKKIIKVISFFIVICLSQATFAYPGETPFEISEVKLETLEQNFTKSTSTKVVILTYHQVRDFNKKDNIFAKEFITPINIFETQMKYLKENDYSIISFDDLVNNLNKNTPLPENPVIITFDDGYRNQYTNAYPILKKYNLRANFFIYTKAINKNYPIAMSWKDIIDMDKNNMTIGAHTVSHPKLNKITDTKILEREIAGSKKILEDKIGKPVNIFSYPYGLTNATVTKIVEEAGYIAAVSDSYGNYHTQKDIFKLNRYNINSNMGLFYELFPAKKSTLK